MALFFKHKTEFNTKFYECNLNSTRTAYLSTEKTVSEDSKLKFSSLTEITTPNQTTISANLTFTTISISITIGRF